MHNNKTGRLFLKRRGWFTKLLPGLLAGLVLLSGCASKSKLTYPPRSGEVLAEIESFRNDQGEAIVSLFAIEQGFPDDMERAWQNLRVKISSGRAQALFTGVPYGEYALCVLHDEDGDSKMKSSWLGQPLEGFGFSGHPEYNFGPPDFEDAVFLLVSESRKLAVRMRYNTEREKKQSERRNTQAGKK